MTTNQNVACLASTIILLSQVACGDATPAPWSAEQETPQEDSPSLPLGGSDSLLAVAVGEYGHIVEVHASEVPYIVASPASNELASVTQLTDGTWLAVGEAEVVRRTNDGWVLVDVPVSFPFSGVAALRDGGAIIVGKSAEALVLDAGRWRTESMPVPPTAYLLGIDTDANGDVAVAVGREDGLDSELPNGLLVQRSSAGEWTLERRGEDRKLVSVGVIAPGQFVFGGYSDFLAGEPLALFEAGDGNVSHVDGLPWRRHVTAIDVRTSGQNTKIEVLAVTDGGGTPDSLSGGLVLKRTEGWSVVGDMLELTGDNRALYGACLAPNNIIAVGPSFPLGSFVAFEEDGTWITTPLATGRGALHGIACRRFGFD